MPRRRVVTRPPLPRRAIVWFPPADLLADVECFRALHDPLAGTLPAHVTLVFPFASALGAVQVAAHVRRAVARTFDQPHPVFALVRADVAPHLCAFLEGGGRKIDAWYATLAVVEVPFDDEADAFRNINTAAELAAAHAR